MKGKDILKGKLVHPFDIDGQIQQAYEFGNQIGSEDLEVILNGNYYIVSCCWELLGIKSFGNDPTDDSICNLIDFNISAIYDEENDFDYDSNDEETLKELLFHSIL